MTTINIYSYVSTLVLFVYSGIHLTQWNAHFPTNLERILWFAACGWMLMALPLFVCDELRLFPSTLANWFNNLWFVLCIFASIYIVVESFISLRSLPAGAYTTVRWTEFLPHV